MLKFSQFIIEKALVAKGKRLKHEYDNYLKPYLPGGKKHTGEATHTINRDHFEKGGDKVFSMGDKVTIHGIRDINDVRHVEVSKDGGEKHFIPANKLNKVGGRSGRSQEEVEESQIADIHKHLTEHLARTGQTSTLVNFPDGTSARVAGIKQVTEKDASGRKVKADAYLHDENGKPIHYMSLKGHRFQQFGGVTEHSDKPSVQDAVKKFKAAAKEDSSRRHQYALNPDSNPEHRELVHQSMYGTNHGKEYGVNNVHAVYTGSIGLRPNENGGLDLYLSASKFHSNKNNNKNSDYVQAKILRRNASDRSDMGVTGSRIGRGHQDESPNAIDVSKRSD